MREQCTDCGTTDGKRRTKGMCDKCYYRWHYQQNKQKYIDRANNWRNNNSEQYRKTRVIISRRKRASRTEAQKKAVNRQEWQRKVSYMTDSERETRRQRSQEWYRSHKDSPHRRLIAKNAKHRRRTVEKQGSITKSEWESTLERYGGKCAYCGSSSEIQMDHIIPVKMGGTHTSDNIVPACRPCNRSKSGRLLSDWFYGDH